MKIAILNGAMEDSNNQFDDYISNLKSRLEQNQHEVTLFNLTSMKINQCIGCWSCWLKKPGICIHEDDANKIFSAVINADLMILASPLIAGFTSSILKKITDRLIVLIHPYIEIREKECHHEKRYDKYPRLGVIVEPEADTDSEDLIILEEIHQRFCINFFSELFFLKTTNNSIDSIIYENINR